MRRPCALDTQTERDIQDSLLEMGQGRSVITIAHRLSTIADADLIVVLEAGLVREQGTHDELLALNGRYSAMWERQFGRAGPAAMRYLPQRVGRAKTFQKFSFCEEIWVARQR